MDESHIGGEPPRFIFPLIIPPKLGKDRSSREYFESVTTAESDLVTTVIK
jgi:hypothetical protein